MLAVLGPSGSGKTTLISVIAGLLTATSGEVLIDGKALHLTSAREASRYRRNHVGIVFQEHHLVPYLSARENLLLVPHLSGRITKADSELADELLDSFGISGRANHHPAALSGGERQRVAIARAFMNSPKIMLVDEPTASLDTDRGLQVVELLKREVRDRGMTCVMVTHDLRMAEHSDEQLLMIDGRAESSNPAPLHASR